MQVGNQISIAASKINEIQKAIMTKTLRITSIIVVVLAIVFFALPAVFAVRSDKQAEQFLSSPSAIEQFNKTRDQKSKKSESQISPLVKQAEAFARYLNPPPKPEPKRTTPSRRPSKIPRPTAPVSSKFELIGTSYYELRPELSLALIDEPSKDLRWVRQSDEIGHLVIEQIKDGLVVVRDGKRTFELVPERPKKISLLKHDSPLGTKSETTRQPPQPPEMSEEQVTVLTEEQEKFMAQEAAITKKMLAEIEAMLISDEEANSLSRLGTALQERQEHPDRFEADITERQPSSDDANSIDPNSPE